MFKKCKLKKIGKYVLVYDKKYHIIISDNFK